MPKTTKPFDWEVYDENDNFLDILTMTRDEMKEYKHSHPSYTLKEISYSDDRGDNSWNSDSGTFGNVHRIRIPKRRRKLSDVY